ncbi:Uncharacterised protein [Bordetella pertussis]|nr:Uncharacterised protein [Bordetella pertussis]
MTSTNGAFSVASSCSICASCRPVVTSRPSIRLLRNSRPATLGSSSSPPMPPTSSE